MATLNSSIDNVDEFLSEAHQCVCSMSTKSFLPSIYKYNYFIWIKLIYLNFSFYMAACIKKQSCGIRKVMLPRASQRLRPSLRKGTFA